MLPTAVLDNTSERSAADDLLVSKGELVREDLLARDLGSQKVRQVLSQMDAGARASDAEVTTLIVKSLVLLPVLP